MENGENNTSLGRGFLVNHDALGAEPPEAAAELIDSFMDLPETYVPGDGFAFSHFTFVEGKSGAVYADSPNIPDENPDETPMEPLWPTHNRRPGWRDSVENHERDCFAGYEEEVPLDEDLNE